MKITHNKVGQNLSLKDTAKSDKSSAAGKVDVKDAKASTLQDLGKGQGATQVQISNRAQDILRAKEIAMKTPDVDEAKVARLQKMIDEGKYKVDAKEIASKMVDEHATWE